MGGFHAIDSARGASDVAGWLLYGIALTALALTLGMSSGADDARIVLVVGVIGLWRYAWGAVHLLRAFIYLRFRFPTLRARAMDAALPPEIFVVITAYREETRQAVRVFEGLLTAADACPVRATIVALVTDPAEQVLLEDRVRPRPRLRLVTILQDGSGKRAALGEALRAVSRRGPRPDAVVFVMDGDSLLPPDALSRCLPFFGHDPNLGALTTDARAEVAGSAWMCDWYMLRYTQRHLLMASMSLSRRLLVLTGRLSAFRAGIATAPSFIQQIEQDSLDHWRYGRFRFLTGDDKSSWFWLLSRGWRMLYIPDVTIRPLESPQGPLLAHALPSMARWFGNMLRNNGRALALGPRRIGLFTWWCLVDQRLSMWTAMSGLAFAVVWSVLVSAKAMVAYALWVLTTRLAQACLVGGLRGRITPRMPLLLYFNQVAGAAVKIHVAFRLNRQRWTRQSIGNSAAPPRQALWDGYLSTMAVAIFLMAAALATGALRWPDALAAAAMAARAADTAVAPEHARRLQHLLDTAPPGAVLRLGPGDFLLDAPLLLRRDDIALVGAGRDATRLTAAFPGNDIGILSIIGQATPARCGRLLRPAGPHDRQLAVAEAPAAGHIMITAANDDAFLDALGARVWRKAAPELRRTLAHVAAGDAGTLTLTAPLGLDMPTGSRICAMALRSGVAVRDLTVAYELAGKPDPAAYANTRPEAAVDGIRVVGAADVVIERVAVTNAGRHPLHFDTVLNPRVDEVVLDGAWNKGVGGNGYLRLARTVGGEFRHLTVRGLRHVAIQWSSHGNRLIGLDNDGDVNFHGGFTHDNRVETILLRPRPGHPWPAVKRTPDDAAWAPPDGPGNVVAQVKPDR